MIHPSVSERELDAELDRVRVVRSRRVPGDCVELNSVQGQAPIPDVVKVQETGAVMALPARSVAPLSVAV